LFPEISADATMREQKMPIAGRPTPGGPTVPSRSQVPLLLLAGVWMQGAGFYPGARVRVDVVDDGRLVVTRADNGDAGRELRPVVWLPAEQIGRIEEAAVRERIRVSHV
jgi:hypothetical protein